MILADTGFFYALLDRDDAWHARAVAASKQSKEGWITTWPVLTEAVHLITKWLGPDPAEALMSDVADGAITVWDLPRRDIVALVDKMHACQNLPMDLADASLVLLAESLGHGRIYTTDQRDFNACRWKETKPFDNLLLTDH
jgi:predicted nucleic acid-binding protein